MAGIPPAFAITFSDNSPVFSQSFQDEINDNDCSLAWPDYGNNTGNGGAGLYSATNANECFFAVYEWDISSIPLGAVITDVLFKYDVDTISNARNCDFIAMYERPSTSIHTQLIIDEINSDVDYLDNDVTCASTGDNKSVDLGALADTDVTAATANGWFAIAVKPNLFDPNVDADASHHYSIFGATPTPTLEIVYTPLGGTMASTTLTLGNVGDIFRLISSVTITDGLPAPTIDNMTYYRNGTQIYFNDTDLSGVVPFTINYVDPIWKQINDTEIYNFTATAGITNATGESLWFEDKEYQAREYGPEYFPAIIQSQGNVNYTLPGAPFGVHVNRETGGDPFQIECTCLDFNDAFQNKTAGDTWVNETSTGYLQYSCPSGTFITACYNDDLLFVTSYPANSSAILVSGTAIFDQLGGFLGAPAALVVVLGIYSLATGRNFPIISVIAMAAIGIMGALGLLILSGEIWGLLSLT